MNNYIYNQMVYFTIMFDFTWSVSDCEELSGVVTGDSPRLNSFSRLNGFVV